MVRQNDGAAEDRQIDVVEALEALLDLRRARGGGRRRRCTVCSSRHRRRGRRLR